MTMPAPESRAPQTGPFGAGTAHDAAFEAATRVKPLALEVGVGVVGLADPARGSDLLQQFAPARVRVAAALGFVMPSVTLREDPDLRADAYAIRVRGVPVAHGTARPGRWLAVVGQSSDWAAASPGEPTSDPATGRAAYWIGEDDVARALALGHHVLGPTAAMAAHLEAVVRANAWRLLDREHVVAQLEALSRQDPRLAAAIARRCDLGLLTRVLRRLLAEGVSIRDFQAVGEALDETPAGVQASLALAEHVRRRLAPAICRGVAPDGVLHVVDLRAWERLALRRADAALRPGPAYPLGPLASRALAALRARVLAAGTPGQVAVVRAPARLRPHLGVLLAAGPGPMTVLAHEEVPPDFTVLAAAPPQLPAGVRARNMVRRWRVRRQLAGRQLAEGLGWLLALGRLVRELPAALAPDLAAPQRLATEAERVQDLVREAEGVRDHFGPRHMPAPRVVVLGPAELASLAAGEPPLAFLARQEPAVIHALLAPLPDAPLAELLGTWPSAARLMLLDMFPPARRAALQAHWAGAPGDLPAPDALAAALDAFMARLGLGPGPAPAPADAAPADAAAPPWWPATGADAEGLAPAIAGRDRPLAIEADPDVASLDPQALQELDSELVAELLAGAAPEQAAEVLSLLPPGFADMVLAHMAADRQEDLITRLQAHAYGAPAPLAWTQAAWTPGPPNEGPFGFLEQMDPEMVADLLAQERPGTAAGVMAALNPGFVDAVLSVMPPEMQEDLIDRLQQAPQLPAFQATQVARNLRRRLGVPV